MFCKNCGEEIGDAKYCPNCGTASNQSFAQKVHETAESVFEKTEDELKNAIHDVAGTTYTDSSEYRAYGPTLKEDRSLLTYILLSIITCGIYGYYFIYKIAEDVNVACYGDGKTTGGLVKFILLSFITCGIYAWYWYYALGNRLAENAPRYGLQFQENGTTVLLWYIIGALICGIGPFIAMYILIKNTNEICSAYNRQR